MRLKIDIKLLKVTSKKFNHIIPLLTILSLQGTLAKRTKPSLHQNFAKEPFRPSRSKAGLGYHANLKSNQINMNNNRQCLTANILQRGDLVYIWHCISIPTFISMDKVVH